MQLDGDKWGSLQCLTREKEFRFVVLMQCFAVFIAHHRGQLLKVANHQELHTTKRSSVDADAAESSVHAVQKVGTHHRDFVNDNEIERTNQFAFSIRKTELFFAELAAWDVHAKGQLKERVYGDSSGIDGSDASGCKHHHPFVALLTKLAQKGGFSRTGTPREKEIGVCVLYYFVR